MSANNYNPNFNNSNLNELNYNQFIQPIGISAFHRDNSELRVSYIPTDTAIRLFYSVNRPLIVTQTETQNGSTFITQNVINETSNPGTRTIDSYNNQIENNELSVISMNSEENTCRICRQKRSDIELLNNTCKCTGTMGYIHLKCLYRWIRYRQKTTCEICHTEFRIPPERRNYYQLLKSFFHPQCIGTCAKHILNLVSITPLIYFTVNQMICTIESINEDGAVKIFVVGPILLMATSLYLFLYFEWAMSSLIQIKNILGHWWNFGDQNDDDFPVLEIQESNRGFFGFQF